MTISIIALSGSLRKKSTNTQLLKAIEGVGLDVSFLLYEGLADLPPFNPDQEMTPNTHTENWIQQVRQADVFIVAVPEYAHGIPGAFKNALDWLVGSDAFIDKPFCIYQACPRSLAAPKALLEVLKTMSGQHIVKSDLTIDLHRNTDTAGLILAEAETKQKIENSIAYLCDVVTRSV